MKHKNLFAKIASLSLVALGLMSQVIWAQGSSGNHPSFVPGRILVKFKDGVSDGQARGLLATRNALSTNVIPQLGVHIVQLPPNANEQAEANAFKGMAEVEFAEVDLILQPQAVTPNDPYYSNQWNLPAIQAPNAWSVSEGSSSVTIAVVDMGVDWSHPDLAAKQVAGWDIFDNNNGTTYSGAHGTMVAGTAAAVTDNGLGVAGACWNCMIMSVRVADNTGAATLSNIAAGISWAANHGARVINLGYQVTGSGTVSAAAQAAGVLVVAPAGDYGYPYTNPDDPNILEVGSTDQNNVIYSWSDTGPFVDLVAPGCTYTTYLYQTYQSGCGTSFSAPLVSAVAALMLSVNSSLSQAQLTSYLEQSAVDLGTPGRDNSYGWGLLNASAAVNLASGGSGPTATTTALVSSLNPSTLNQSVTFTATVTPSTATGAVTFLDGTTTLGTGTLAAGVATFSTASLAVATHSITAKYAGNSSYNASTSSVVSQVVNTASKTNTTTSVTSSANPSVSGQSVTFTATVSPSAATGTVTFLDGTTTLGTGTLSGGIATFATASLTVGTHSITANYGGNSSYNSSTSSVVTQTVNTVAKTNTSTTLGSSLNPSVLGNLVSFTATVSPSAATGTVTFLDGTTTLGTATLSGGIATFATSTLATGSHSITASYNGDTNYNGSTSPTVSQAVNKAGTSTGLTSSLNPSISGQSVTFTATVSPSTATGTVTFLDGATTLGTSSLSGGTTTFATSSLTVASHSITAQYNGDGNYNTSTSPALSQTVNAPAKTNTTTSVASNLNPSNVGLSVTFTAAVSPSAATGTVTFLDGGSSIGSGTLSGGQATFTTSSLSVGGHSITASYGGDSGDNGSISTVLTQTVNMNNTSTSLGSTPNPSSASQMVSLTATVSPSTATGTVTFLDGGTQIGSASLSGGKATFSTSSLSPGSHSMTASYGGNSGDNGSTSGIMMQTVNKVNSTNSLGSNQNPSSWSQLVTFTATVSPSTATGSVSFLDGGVQIGSAALSGGSATFSTSGLSVGTHSITASYGGDTSDNGSVSSAVSQTVNKSASTTTLGSSLNPSISGQAVNFMVTVSPAGATGTVTFLDGTATLGTGTLSGGATTFSTASLSVGTHSITASYGGDGNYSASTSSVVLQAVNSSSGAPPTVSITSPAPGRKGAAPTVSGTIVIAGTAGDNSGSFSVAVAVNGAVVCTIGNVSPWSCSWNTTTFPNAIYTVTATAVDPSGNSSAASLAVKVSNGSHKR